MDTKQKYIFCDDNKFRTRTNSGWVYVYKTKCSFCNKELYRRIADKKEGRLNFCDNTCKSKYNIKNNLNKKHGIGIEEVDDTTIRKFTGKSWSYLKKTLCTICGKEILREKRITKQSFCSSKCKAKTTDKNVIKNKILDVMFKRFLDFPEKIGIKPLFTRKEYFGQGYDKIYKWQCIKCNTIFDHWYYEIGKLHCPVCTKNSNIEQKVIDFITKYETIVLNTRSIIKPYEIDIYIPEKKIGIEINGLYWHSESMGANSSYHLMKTEEAQKAGIFLIQLFADEIMYKWPIVKNRLMNILKHTKYKIWARNCYIKEIDIKTKDKFLNKYHIQGQDHSNKHIGLFYKSHLISVMTFSKFRKVLGREHRENCWELSRFATISKFNIVGAAGKLLSYFEKKYKPQKIISYADRRWSNGNLYYNLGFTMTRKTRPSYWYTKDYLNRIYRFNFRKSILKNKIINFNPNISEWENMKANGYDRIWDCGTLLFEKQYNIL
jgi:endogenous inhibitor of DNA gyrase (YacG/DUF329 family)